MRNSYDKIIIGAGIYGLYAALTCARKGERVVVLDKEEGAFCRATYINQARVHNGYHYPRSYSTAIKSAHYFERFVKDFGFCVADGFKQIYATSAAHSWTDRSRFKKFCNDADVPCTELSPDIFFNDGMCDGAYLTLEYAFDAFILRDWFLSEIKKHSSVELRFSSGVERIEKGRDSFIVSAGADSFEAPFVLNATYAGSNEINSIAGFDAFKIKYELCEIIICDVGKELRDIGITVMDGPFFSIMPFGKTGLHSLTSVTFTPHITSYDLLPTYGCQAGAPNGCSPSSLKNCDLCAHRPDTAYPYMSTLARKYLLPKYSFSYKKSLFSVKPIMKASEVDDSRPTVIRVQSENPTFISVLSGKINTIYDLDEVL